MSSYLALMPEPPPGRNPFLTQMETDQLALGGAPGASTTLPVLRGTLWSEDRRVAWIGADAVLEGDVIRGLRIEKIEKDGIWVRTAEQTYRIPVTQSEPASAAPEDSEGPPETEGEASAGGMEE